MINFSFASVRSLFSFFSFESPSVFTTRSFTTTANADELTSSVAVSAYTSRTLRTFRALRTLRSRRVSDTSSLRLRFLFGGDRTNARRAVRQALRPVFAQTLPNSRVVFSFRPAGSALRHPKLSPFSLGYPRRLQQGSALERELAISGNSPTTEAIVLLPKLLNEIATALKGLGRRDLQINGGTPFSSTSPLQLRLLSINFPETFSVSRRRADQVAYFLNSVPQLTNFGPSAVSLNTVKTRESVIGGLLTQRERGATGSISVCLFTPLPFVSLLSLLERRCDALRGFKLMGLTRWYRGRAAGLQIFARAVQFRFESFLGT